jgi:hypothetical protein
VKEAVQLQPKSESWQQSRGKIIIRTLVCSRAQISMATATDGHSVSCVEKEVRRRASMKGKALQLIRQGFTAQLQQRPTRACNTS